ncbi:alanine--tRNA ligase [Helicobacter brantae]|uniref:Alanine--tRNA ligase n=1 Tax=Helicobacter brantae TaxID=375927 RepID=A0A3D8IZP3_9HELI|nr:alanine--tRNA ligase [Helicobacter brantae]RDU70446.1 alanine--tRNA ligase [Helicobacter brantae]
MKVDVRSKFLEFFASKGHQVYASMPLVPDDPTLLFTNAGMVQFKDIFTGKVASPSIPRATSSQLCIRAGGKHNDLENVGYTARHHTLFEMLGNFSFGDYFKEQAIAYAWEFVTEVLGFSKEVLYVTVHESDDEAFELWSKHIDPSRIKRLGDKDNFWQMGDTGPCGPCSEIFVDQGEEYFRGEEDYFGGDGDRFLEIWNLVFMQYERSEDGTLTPLPKPSIDTGMGLERVVALLEGKRSNFDSSIFMPLIERVVELCGKPYVYESGASYRVIADHARSVAFLLAQGVHFDKEGRGYVLRRILRRAVRHGYLLGLKKPFLFEVVEKVCEMMGGVYPYLLEKKSFVSSQCKGEEQRFFETLEMGMNLFKKELQNTSAVFSGEVAFKLYDTYGFPLDLTADMLKDSGIEVDVAEFESCMQKQRELAKASWKGSGDEASGGELGKVASLPQESLSRAGVGSAESEIAMLFDKEGVEVSSLVGEGYVMLEKNPFYAQGGGAVGDSGWLYEGESKIAEINDTRNFFGKEVCKVIALSPLSTHQKVSARVDIARQLEIKKHHSATHLLHAVLREVLGEGVAQAGSLVEENRLRFDFSFPRALSSEEIERVEREVNALITQTLKAQIEEMGIEEAKRKGAMALFGEKYGERVRVVSFGDRSCELCGGLHIEDLGMIGSFFILKESGVSSGVRRIEAVCGKAGYEYALKALSTLQEAKEALKSQDLLASIHKLQEQIKELKEKNKKLSSNSNELKAEEINGVKVIISLVQGESKEMIDNLKNKYEKVVALLISENEGKITISAGVKNAPLKAGVWVKEIAQILGGNGGGRDDFATAGGKDSSKIAEALEKAKLYVSQNIIG